MTVNPNIDSIRGFKNSSLYSQCTNPSTIVLLFWKNTLDLFKAFGTIELLLRVLAERIEGAEQQGQVFILEQLRIPAHPSKPENFLCLRKQKVQGS